MSSKNVASTRKFKKILSAVFVGLVLWSPFSFAVNRALMIIDMQQYYMDRRIGMKYWPSNAKKIQRVIARQIELINLAKEQHLPILLVEFATREPTLPVLQKAIGEYDNVERFLKMSNGVFDANAGTKMRLVKYLYQNNINDIVMVGANGSACVACSIEGGMRSGHRIWIDNVGTIDFNRLNFTHPYYFEKDDLQVGQQLFDERFIQVKSTQAVNEFLKDGRLEDFQIQPNLPCEQSLTSPPKGNL